MGNQPAEADIQSWSQARGQSVWGLDSRGSKYYKKIEPARAQGDGRAVGSEQQGEGRNRRRQLATVQKPRGKKKNRRWGPHRGRMSVRLSHILPEWQDGQGAAGPTGMAPKGQGGAGPLGTPSLGSRKSLHCTALHCAATALQQGSGGTHPQAATHERERESPARPPRPPRPFLAQLHQRCGTGVAMLAFAP